MFNQIKIFEVKSENSPCLLILHISVLSNAYLSIEQKFKNMLIALGIFLMFMMIVKLK